MVSELGYRGYCLDEKGEECELCGASAPIVAHHINGDRSDNRLENLMPVCRSCHRSIHHDSETHRHLTDKLPSMSIIDPYPGGLRPHAYAVLEVLAVRAANPYHIREETGLDKGDVNTVLNRLGRAGYLQQVTRGLYEITEKGRAEVDRDDA